MQIVIRLMMRNVLVKTELGQSDVKRDNQGKEVSQEWLRAERTKMERGCVREEAGAAECFEEVHCG